MVSEPSKIPQWIVDDLSYVNTGHVFVAHTHHPRFYGELYFDGDDADAPIGGVTLSGNGFTIAGIQWIDSPGDLDPSILHSLAEVLEIRDSNQEELADG